MWAQDRSSEPTRESPFSESTESWALVVAGSLLLCATLAVCVQQGLKLGMSFAACAGLGCATLWLSAEGLLSGKIQCLEEGSSEQIQFRENPFRFLITLSGWVGVTAFLFWAAAGLIL